MGLEFAVVQSTAWESVANGTSRGSGSNHEEVGGDAWGHNEEEQDEGSMWVSSWHRFSSYRRTLMRLLGFTRAH